MSFRLFDPDAILREVRAAAGLSPTCYNCYSATESARA
jgi:hypothetical protein